MVQEPSHVKQLSPIHVCKIGLRKAAMLVTDFLAQEPRPVLTRINPPPPSMDAHPQLKLLPR